MLGWKSLKWFRPKSPKPYLVLRVHKGEFYQAVKRLVQEFELLEAPEEHKRRQVLMAIGKEFPHVSPRKSALVLAAILWELSG